MSRGAADWYDRLSGHDFEDLVEGLLLRMGFAISGRRAAGDGGIDMIATRDDPLTGGKFVIQCKRYQGPVGVPFVRDLYGVLHSEAASKGILITNSTFTPQATEFAVGKPLELVDGEKLVALLATYGPEGDAPAVARPDLSPVRALVVGALSEPLAEYAEQMARMAAGLVHVSRRNLDVQHYLRFISAQLGERSALMETLEAVINNSLGMAMIEGEPSSECIVGARRDTQEILAMADALAQLQRRARAVQPPQTWEEAHRAYLASFVEAVRELQKLPEAAGHVTPEEASRGKQEVHILAGPSFRRFQDLSQDLMAHIQIGEPAEQRLNDRQNRQAEQRKAWIADRVLLLLVGTAIAILFLFGGSWCGAPAKMRTAGKIIQHASLQPLTDEIARATVARPRR